MSQNSDAMELLSLDLPSAKCVLLGGDCECFTPKTDCNYVGVHVFFSKKGRVLNKEEKLKVLQKQAIGLNKRVHTAASKLFKVERLIEEVEGT